MCCKTIYHSRNNNGQIKKVRVLNKDSFFLSHILHLVLWRGDDYYDHFYNIISSNIINNNYISASIRIWNNSIFISIWRHYSCYCINSAHIQIDFQTQKEMIPITRGLSFYILRVKNTLYYEQPFL